MWGWPHHQQSRSGPFPPEWRRLVETDCPFFQRLPDADREALEARIQLFLSEKHFEGCGGLQVTGAMQVILAAFACLLPLHREKGCYPDLQSVLIYPGAFVASNARHVGSGIMEESRHRWAGESWRDGALVLTWDEVCQAMAHPGSGHNVVWHEFAHQLDFGNSEANGLLPRQAGESWRARKRRQARFKDVMRAEYAGLKAAVQRGEPTVLRPYGATNAAEFFAVATECFFCQPLRLRQRRPELYEALRQYYGQDPAQLGWDWPESPVT